MKVNQRIFIQVEEPEEDEPVCKRPCVDEEPIKRAKSPPDQLLSVPAAVPGPGLDLMESDLSDISDDADDILNAVSVIVHNNLTHDWVYKENTTVEQTKIVIFVSPLCAAMMYDTFRVKIICGFNHRVRQIQ